MKLAGLLLVLTFSTVSLADTFYVRKTVAGSGVQVGDANMVRSLVTTNVSALGYKLAKNSSQANFTYRSYLEKNAQGFKIKLEKSQGGTVISGNEMVAPDTSQFADIVKKLVIEGTVAVTTPSASLPTKTAIAEMNDDTNRALAATPVAMAVESSADSNKQIHGKTWYISMGPILASSILGTTTGTRFSIDFGYHQAISEKISLIYLYDGNFNTSSQGSTPVSTIGVAGQFNWNDRLSPSSPFLHLDIGYGGANRNEDASATGGLGIGWDFFRTTDFTFAVEIRRVVVATQATTGIGSYPTIDQLRFGIFF